jgi:hypothetical protein
LAAAAIDVYANLVENLPGEISPGCSGIVNQDSLRGPPALERTDPFAGLMSLGHRACVARHPVGNFGDYWYKDTS